jgi:16S rRNA (cytosine967-C5)-methyltransferase
VSVQDCAAQLAASLLDLQPGQRVLDACAAPGGKTAHILETLQAGGDRDPGVVAVDHDATRLARVDDTLGRLGLSAELKQGDALRPDDWRQGESFDRILLDAPCSASGVIRRHPDIKLLRQAEDIPALARVQGEMLDAMWPLLTPGGMLLYATCSVFAAENHQVVAGFVVRTADAREHEISASWGVAQPHGRQILSGEQNMDGFYYARLKKNKT